MPLRVHSFLRGIPLRTLSRVDLPGGLDGLTIRGISTITGFGNTTEIEAGPLTKSFFWLRNLIGRILGWDDAKELVESVTYLSRLSREDRVRSLMKPGTELGVSRVLYCFENELLVEFVNYTVHGFLLMTRERTADGYELYFAVYVRKLNSFTPVYMALVSPILKWIIYPVMMKGVKRRWERTFPQGASPARGMVESK